MYIRGAGHEFAVMAEQPRNVKNEKGIGHSGCDISQPTHIMFHRIFQKAVIDVWKGGGGYLVLLLCGRGLQNALPRFGARYPPTWRAGMVAAEHRSVS